MRSLVISGMLIVGVVVGSMIAYRVMQNPALPPQDIVYLSVICGVVAGFGIGHLNGRWLSRNARASIKDYSLM